MTLPYQELHVMMDAAHDLSITIAIKPITNRNPIQHPQGMTVSNTTTLITDRGAKPEGFAFPLGCGFQISVPSARVVTSPTYPTRDIILMDVPLGMHHLGGKRPPPGEVKMISTFYH